MQCCGDAFRLGVSYVSEYVNHFPKNCLRQSVKGFVSGFVITTILRKSPTAGLMAGSLSVVATVVHAAISPLFQAMIGNENKELSWHQEMARGSIAYIAAATVGLACGNRAPINGIFTHAIGYAIYVVFDKSVRRVDETTWQNVTAG